MRTFRWPVTKILVTRPRELVSAMSRKLREKGAEVLELPAISTMPIPDNNASPEGHRRA